MVRTSASLSLALLLSFATPALALPPGDEATGERSDAEPESGSVDPTIVAAVGELLVVPHEVKPGNAVRVRYPLQSQDEMEDFEGRGFDKCEVTSVVGSNVVATSLEIGAGSRRTGTLLHRLPLRGDFKIEMELWVNGTASSSRMCILLNKKVGVAWGQTIVKPKSLRSYNRKARPNMRVFGGERKVTVRIERRANELTVSFNGRETDKRTFKKGELEKTVRFGLLARNMRFVVTSLSIEGTVDPSKL